MGRIFTLTRPLHLELIGVDRVVLSAHIQRGQFEPQLRAAFQITRLLDLGHHAMSGSAARNRQHTTDEYVLNDRKLNRLAVLGSLAVHRLIGPQLQ